MSEEIQNQNTQPDSQEPQNTGNTKPDNGGQEEQPMFTQSQLNAILQDRLGKEKKKREEMESQLSEFRTQVEKMNAEKEEKKRAEMSEIEKLQADLEKRDKELKQLMEEKDDILGKFRQQTVNSAFKDLASKYDIEHTKAAMKLAKDELSQVEISEDGSVEGLEDIVKSLVEENPFLVSQKQPKKPVGAPTNPSNHSDEKTSEQRLNEAYAKAKKTGNPQDFIAYRRLKRQLGQ